MKWFKKKETYQEKANRILDLCKDVDCGILSPPMDAQVALNELCRYFLGENWCVVNSISQEQINTEIVYEIELNYKSKIRRKLWII